MPLSLDAAQRCENYALDPNVGFKSQYAIAAAGTARVPGMAELAVNKWAVLHGDAVNPDLLYDEKGRVFGVFFGTGVDSEGAVVTGASFARFNSKARSFEADLEDYLSGIAGRFIMMLDSGSKTRLYRDPMGHMPLFYNAETHLAGSSIYLTLDRAVTGNPVCAPPGADPNTTISVFPMGQTSDTDVRLMPGNHVLDLSDFTAHRGWPLRNSIRKVTTAKVVPVIDKMAMRLRTIVQGWIMADDVVLPLDASAGARILLAAAGDRRDELADITVLQPGGADDPNTLAVAHIIAEAAGCTVQAVTREDALQTFGNARAMRNERKRLYWLRTSSALRIPRGIALGIDAMFPAQHIVLTSRGLDALQSGWVVGAPAPKPLRASQSSEIAAALAGKPEKSVRDAVADDYERWKSSLPKTLQSEVADFIRIELHEPPKAVATLGYSDHIPASPFSDRELIELALKLPASLRAGPAFAEALITALDPALADLPYEASLAESTAAE